MIKNLFILLIFLLFSPFFLCGFILNTFAIHCDMGWTASEKMFRKLYSRN